MVEIVYHLVYLSNNKIRSSFQKIHLEIDARVKNWWCYKVGRGFQKLLPVCKYTLRIAYSI